MSRAGREVLCVGAGEGRWESEGGDGSRRRRLRGALSSAKMEASEGGVSKTITAEGDEASRARGGVPSRTTSGAEGAERG